MAPFYYSQESSGPLPYNVLEQIFSIRALLDLFLAKLLFNNDASRIIYSDPDYSYRRRIEQLGEIGQASSLDALQLPFLSYYSPLGWVKDTRAGAKQISSAAHKIRWGGDGEGTGVEAQIVHVEREYECVALFSTMRDAEIAISLLQWWADRVHHDEYVLTASNTQVLFPLSMELVSATLDAGNYLDKWSKEQNIVAVRFNFNIKTPLAKMDPNQGPVYITEQVYWYFHNREFSLPMEEMETIPLETSELFHIVASSEEVPPYVGLSNIANIVLTTPSPTSAEFNWDYIGSELPSSLVFYVHLGSEVREQTIVFEENDTTETAETTCLFENLPGGRVLDAVILATYGTAVNKYHFSIQMPTIPSRRKGLAGLKGMIV